MPQWWDRSPHRATVSPQVKRISPVGGPADASITMKSRTHRGDCFVHPATFAGWCPGHVAPSLTTESDPEETADQ